MTCPAGKGSRTLSATAEAPEYTSGAVPTETAAAPTAIGSRTGAAGGKKRPPAPAPAAIRAAVFEIELSG